MRRAALRAHFMHPLRAAILASLAALAAPARGLPAGSPDDDILFVGMTPGSAVEARALRASGARVVQIQDAAEPDRIRAEADGRDHDLTEEHGIMDFAGALGLSREQAARVAATIGGAMDDSRDELARIAEVWARAERGGAVPARLVLSGHSAGESVWGEDNGSLSFSALEALAAALPAAAAQVEDVQLAGCHTGGLRAIGRLLSMFPNLRTAWTYAGSAPGAMAGAAEHARRWERATRGRVDLLRREAAAGSRKGDEVAVWSAQGGYEGGESPSPLVALRAAIAEGTPMFLRHLRGELEVEHPQLGPLRDHYSMVQELLSIPDLPRAERALLERRRDQALRLLYYRSVASRFAAAHASAIRAGYLAAGLAPPDFAALPRRAALARIAALGAEVRGARRPPAAAAALLPLLEEGLRDLRASRIPETWI